jgi:hypothetical protein
MKIGIIVNSEKMVKISNDEICLSVMPWNWRHHPSHKIKFIYIFIVYKRGDQHTPSSKQKSHWKAPWAQEIKKWQEVSGRVSPSCSPHSSDNEMSELEEVDLSVLNANDEGEQKVDDNGLIAKLLGPRSGLSETIWVNIFVQSWLWISYP